MKITLITACYNSAPTIRTAIESVISQRGVDVEHIVIDGGSSDGTVEIIKEYSTRSTRSTRLKNFRAFSLFSGSTLCVLCGCRYVAVDCTVHRRERRAVVRRRPKIVQPAS